MSCFVTKFCKRFLRQIYGISNYRLVLTPRMPIFLSWAPKVIVFDLRTTFFHIFLFNNMYVLFCHKILQKISLWAAPMSQFSFQPPKNTNIQSTTWYVSNLAKKLKEFSTPHKLFKYPLQSLIFAKIPTYLWKKVP